MLGCMVAFVWIPFHIPQIVPSEIIEVICNVFVLLARELVSRVPPKVIHPWTLEVHIL